MIFFIRSIDNYLTYNYIIVRNDAGWSSWQLVGLITRRPEVRVLPLLKLLRARIYSCSFFCYNLLVRLKFDSFIENRTEGRTRSRRCADPWEMNANTWSIIVDRMSTAAPRRGLEGTGRTPVDAKRVLPLLYIFKARFYLAFSFVSQMVNPDRVIPALH